MLQRLLFITLLLPAFTLTMGNENPADQHNADRHNAGRSYTDSFNLLLQGMAMAWAVHESERSAFQDIQDIHRVPSHAPTRTNWGISAVTALWSYAFHNPQPTDTLDNPAETRE
jgi:hypothetical protein